MATQVVAPKKALAPTVAQINAEYITQLSNQYWAPHIKKKLPFNPKVIEDIYEREMLKTKFAIRKIMLLEFSQYLENYLWPNYTAQTSSKAHLLSICCMLNEKFRENVSAWEAFKLRPQHVPAFFQRVLATSLSEEGSAVTLREQTLLLVFLDHCFNSLEVDVIREQVQRLISLPTWVCLLPSRLEQELRKTPKLKKFWNLIKKSDEKLEPKAKEQADYERRFLSRLIQKFVSVLNSIPAKGDVSADKVHYCERFIELMIDLEALLPTRRWFNTLLDDSHLVVLSHLSELAQRPKEGKLFIQLLEMLQFYSGFEINDQSGNALTDHDMTNMHYDRLTSLQRVAFANFPELRDFALSNVASIDTRDSLLKHFGELSTELLHRMAARLNLLPPLSDGESSSYSKEFLVEMMVSRHERRISQIQALNEMPLYPTEKIIWNENIVPTEYFSGDGCLALPKLNLQFLTLHDYLLRNFNLFRLESTYEIRQDVEDAVSRMKPWRVEDGTTMFGGWARMAQTIGAFSVVEVAKPHIGENHPSRVRADITLHLNMRQHIKAEWEGLRKHDVCFLVTVRGTQPWGTRYTPTRPFLEQLDLACVRGCEVQGLLDDKGRVIEDGPEPRPQLKGDTRTIRVWLDPNQYQQDMAAVIQHHADDVYENFNLLLRRKPKENNFKAVLETIRDLMNTECVVPDWLHDIILGYGDPGSAHYSKMPNQIRTLNFNDTFLSMEHLKAGFPGHTVRVVGDHPPPHKPPFRITFPQKKDGKKRRAGNAGETASGGEDSLTLLVEPYVPPNPGPYPYNQPKRNTIQFTPTQIEAIRAGMQPGLTMVVGPPGTGKTDVAVQIISNLYHNFPEQRTLIVTHSNQALNQLFEKIMQLDIDERHLLRMGHGEEELETEKDFSRYGRVNYILARRLELLHEVGRLQESLGVPGDVSYTCETAGHFFLYQVMSRWEEFQSKVRPASSGDKGGTAEAAAAIAAHFPFDCYFANAPQPLFHGRSYKEDLEIAEGCFRHLRKIFTQLEEFRAFELLRSGLDRSKYLLVKEAKVIAMTCTHAALKRHDLVQLGFKYDNILMEEAAQILEIETFIPLLLQNPQDGFSRLKRWIMIGDHHQLPPVIKNMAFQKYSNMEQSLFTRFVRLGVPTVDLDAQGRARSSLCNLYNWRYKRLGNLPHVQLLPEFRFANAGLCYDFQLVNVEDFNGVGESEPNPYFYQNLAEAEYAVALFMYMRLLGYPADRISILTTYNGQKHLIRDVVNQRCGENPLFGRPSKVTTVDRFQGQQNDYIILSLVRTKAVGHLRDVRRLVVAMSRARLGLYVFARASLFRNCFELTPAFNQLTARPLQLHLYPDESCPTQRPNGEAARCPPLIVKDMPEMATFVYNMYFRVLQHYQQYYQPLAQPPRSRVPAQPPVQQAKEDAAKDGSDGEATGSTDAMETDSPAALTTETPSTVSGDVEPMDTSEAAATDSKEDGGGDGDQEEKHKKMPEHPGRDSDSDDSEDEADETAVAKEAVVKAKGADGAVTKEAVAEVTDGKEMVKKAEVSKAVSTETTASKEAVAESAAAKEAVAETTASKESVTEEAVAKEAEFIAETVAKEAVAETTDAKEDVAATKVAKQDVTEATVVKESVAEDAIAMAVVAKEDVAGEAIVTDTETMDTAEGLVERRGDQEGESVEAQEGTGQQKS
ncbi:unnamed protein product [Lampetra fluviatilis]